jgi:hypothetical protein
VKLTLQKQQLLTPPRSKHLKVKVALDAVVQFLLLK